MKKVTSWWKNKKSIYNDAKIKTCHKNHILKFRSYNNNNNNNNNNNSSSNSSSSSSNSNKRGE